MSYKKLQSYRADAELAIVHTIYEHVMSVCECVSVKQALQRYRVSHRLLQRGSTVAQSRYVHHPGRPIRDIRTQCTHLEHFNDLGVREGGKNVFNAQVPAVLQHRESADSKTKHGTKTCWVHKVPREGLEHLRGERKIVHVSIKVSTWGGGGGHARLCVPSFLDHVFRNVQPQLLDEGWRPPQILHDVHRQLNLHLPHATQHTKVFFPCISLYAGLIPYT
jgi:hypothetical protein